MSVGREGAFTLGSFFLKESYYNLMSDFIVANISLHQ
jgi:hypothetical protein